MIHSIEFVSSPSKTVISVNLSNDLAMCHTSLFLVAHPHLTSRPQLHELKMTSSRSRAMFSRWHRAKLLPGGRGAVQAAVRGFLDSHVTGTRACWPRGVCKWSKTIGNGALWKQTKQAFPTGLLPSSKNPWHDSTSSVPSQSATANCPNHPGEQLRRVRRDLDFERCSTCCSIQCLAWMNSQIVAFDYFNRRGCVLWTMSWVMKAPVTVI